MINWHTMVPYIGPYVLVLSCLALLICKFVITKNKRKRNKTLHQNETENQLDKPNPSFTRK